MLSQLATKQWGLQRTSDTAAIPVSLPISVSQIFIGVTSNADNNDAICNAIGVVTNNIFYVHTWKGSTKGMDTVAYIVLCR